MDIGLLKGIVSNIDYSHRSISTFICENDEDTLKAKESLLRAMNTLMATSELLKHMIPKENEWDKSVLEFSIK